MVLKSYAGLQRFVYIGQFFDFFLSVQSMLIIVSIHVNISEKQVRMNVRCRTSGGKSAGFAQCSGTLVKTKVLLKTPGT